MADGRSRIPRVVAMPAPDELRRLPLTPVDGFVLSRVDGQSSEDDIVLATGLPIEQVRASLDRLADLSLIAVGEARPPRTISRTMKSPVAEQKEAHAASTPAESGPRVAAAVAPTPPSPIMTPLAGVVAGIDLTAEEQLKILELVGRLDSLDHYALLGVSRAAEKKEIKRAYYERAALYHPDRYFRRKVGPFKPKLEAIFGRVTLAHDVLIDKVQRAEYDAYLATVAHARDLEARVEEGERVVREAQAAASPPSSPAPAASSPSPSAPNPSSASPSAPSPSAPSPPSPSSPAPSSPTPSSANATANRPNVTVDPQSRRDILAKRLTGARAPAAPPPPPPPPSIRAPQAPPDREALKRHFDQKRADVARSQAMQHKNAGDQAMAAGDSIAASSAYKAALSFLPDDPELQLLHAQAEHAAAKALAETYRNQAVYEEKSGRWPDAASSWCKLAELLPRDAEVQERAANAILNAKGNLHDAATAAQRAVTIAPNDPRFRKLLATIYLEAGLLKNARREIDAAEQLAPGDVSIAALAKRLAQATGK